MIIKPLKEWYKLVTLWVTDIESALHPIDFHATEEQLFEAQVLWHACWSIIQHTALDSLYWQYVNNMYIDMLKHLQNSRSQKTKTFYNNLVAWNIIKIWEKYKGIVYCETPLYLRIEAGKYLLFIKSWWLDMAWLSTEDWVKIVYDNKLYSKYFKDKFWQFMWTKYSNSDKNLEIQTKDYDWKIYTVDETMGSELWEKIQWWLYPLMHWFWDKDYIYFQYNVVVKNEAKDKNLMPNVQEIRIKIYKEEAEQLLKNTIVSIFRNHFDETTLKLKEI